MKNLKRCWTPVLAAGFLLAACSGNEAEHGGAVDEASLSSAFDQEYAAGQSIPLEGSQYGNLVFIEGEGVPVVFYYPAGPAWWQMQVEPLSADYQTVVVSEGTVAPPTDGLVSPTHLIDALENLRPLIGAERFTLVTHSISSRIAMELAIRRPDLINALVLEEPAWAPTSDMETPVPPPVQPECELELDNPIDQGSCEFFAFQMGAGRFETLDPGIREYLFQGQREQAEALAAIAPEGELPTQAGPPQFDIICDQLGELDFPILFVRGEDTPAFFAAGMDYYESCLPQHETALVPQATHMVHFENPEAYNAALSAFLDRLGPEAN